MVRSLFIPIPSAALTPLFDIIFRFCNIPWGEPFDKGAISGDYNLQVMIGYKNYIKWRALKENKPIPAEVVCPDHPLHQTLLVEKDWTWLLCQLIYVSFVVIPVSVILGKLRYLWCTSNFLVVSFVYVSLYFHTVLWFFCLVVDVSSCHWCFVSVRHQGPIFHNQISLVLHFAVPVLCCCLPYTKLCLPGNSTSSRTHAGVDDVDCTTVPPHLCTMGRIQGFLLPESKTGSASKT